MQYATQLFIMFYTRNEEDIFGQHQLRILLIVSLALQCIAKPTLAETNELLFTLGSDRYEDRTKLESIVLEPRPPTQDDTKLKLKFIPVPLLHKLQPSPLYMRQEIERDVTRASLAIPLQEVHLEDELNHETSNKYGILIQQDKDPKLGSQNIHIIRMPKSELEKHLVHGFTPLKGQQPFFQLQTKQQGPEGAPGLTIFLW